MKNRTILLAKLDNQTLTSTDAKTLYEILLNETSKGNEDIILHLNEEYLPEITFKEDTEKICKTKLKKLLEEYKKYKEMFTLKLPKRIIYEQECRIEDLASELADFGTRYSLLSKNSFYLDKALSASSKALDEYLNYVKNS